MKDYYLSQLSGNHLHRVYELADEPVTQYLQGEIEYCRQRIRPGDHVLELGCGYGRILGEIAGPAHQTVGIDNAPDNLALARDYLRDSPNIDMHLMSVDNMDFPDGEFDLVLCSQNGLSAFALDRPTVVREALRVTKPTGRLICCTYTRAFWPARLTWFRRQADAGLIGPIDEKNTGNGIITCNDGFVSSSMTSAEFAEISELLGAHLHMEELQTGSMIATLSKTPRSNG